MIDRLIRFCLGNPPVVALLTLLAVGWGVYHAPFDWELPGMARDPVAVDAIPDLGENQQIVFTSWPGRSPRDIEDQVTYPLSVAMLGVPGVRTIRSSSMTGFSSLYIVFRESADFHDSRARILEKLASLSPGTLPDGVAPALGPDATPVGQVFWYTLEGHDPATGQPLGGWSLEEIRGVQDWYVRRMLTTAEGVAEVAGVGGFVREYHIDADPEALRLAGVDLRGLRDAVAAANAEVGARTLERNQMEYLVRGVGFARGVEDFAEAVAAVNDGVPLRVRDLANVSTGPAPRDGALDKDGIEAVGGVVVARYGANPLAVIAAVKARIAEISPGLPGKTLPDGRVSRLRIVPFYDRSGLIAETLQTLGDAIRQQVLVTVVVVLLLLGSLRSGLLVSSLMPLAVLLSFGMMRAGGVDANIVSLSGIAIAIGTISDMGIVLCENLVRRLREAPPEAKRLDVIRRAACEVGGAVTTAVATTIVSFLPVFSMMGAEGKLFRPLAYTKTFCLFAAIVATLTLLPSFALLILRTRRANAAAPEPAAAPPPKNGAWAGWRKKAGGRLARLGPYLAALLVAWPLAADWAPLGADRPALDNYLFAAVAIGALCGLFELFIVFYPRLLGWCLRRKKTFLVLPLALCLAGASMWLGWERLWGWIPAAGRLAGIPEEDIRLSRPWVWAAHAFPGFRKEFMPPLDEGIFLSMPTLMPHASLATAVELMGRQDRLFAAVPEVRLAVGKAGRADSPLDPAPATMLETIIDYHPEYLAGDDGRRPAFRFDPEADDVFRDAAGTPLPGEDGRPIPVRGRFVRDGEGALIPDSAGRAFRQWRPFIRSPDDIWAAVERAGRIPGLTGAPKLHPIEARNVMLQSGLRAPMGVKIKGPTLEAIAAAALDIERLLREVPAIDAQAVAADRPVGKPYLEMVPDRAALYRHGVTMAAVQETFALAVGGETATVTVEGRERYAARVRYPRELRDSPEAIARVLVPTGLGGPVPLGELAAIRLAEGPEMIAAEDTFLVGYVVFGSRPGYSEVETVEAAARRLEAARGAAAWTPPAGVSWTFAGAYENQVRSQRHLAVMLPLALLLIFLVIYLQFRDTATTLILFAGIPLTLAGGMILLWLYGQDWFLDSRLLGVDWRDLFRIRPYHLSVAVWVGFLALFGIATDDGVVMATYLDQEFAAHRPADASAIRAAVLRAGLRRVRPCLMTTATTLLALLPVLTSRGRGAEIMVPMAIPSFGGMVLELLTMFIVPVCYAWRQERALKV